MYDRTGNYLIVAILVGMILAVLAVAIFGEAVLPVRFLGTIFLNALRMIVIPLLFCSIIVGISNLGDIRKLGRTGLKTLLYFLATSSIAVILGLILVNIVQPGVGFSTVSAALPEAMQSRESYSFFGWLTDQIPSNIIGAAAETKVLPVIIFALIFGGVLTTLGSKGRPVISIFDGINEAIMKIVHMIMWFAPIGIFGLVAGQLAAEGGLSRFSSIISALGKYSLVVIVGLLIHAVIVLPLILKFMGGKNPIQYLVGMAQALTTAFATASSSATLPVSMECVEEKNDIDKRASSFVLPLGATINMDGTALYEAVAAMFIAQAYGIDLPLWSQVTIFVTAILASVGAAGIPEAGLVTMVLVLQAVGLPLEGIGLILAIDWFLDRCRTTVNVWGDSVGAAVIATTAEIGLVDRSRLKPFRPEYTSRFRRFGRRDDKRGKRKGPFPLPGEARERQPAQAKKVMLSDAKEAPKPQPKSGKRPRRGDQRPPRRERHPGVPSARENREVRKLPPEPPKERRPEPPPRVTTEPVEAKMPEKKVPAESPVGYGRRRHRPSYTRLKSLEAERKRADKDLSDTGIASPGSDSKKDEKPFEIPKFPESILDELAASVEEPGATKPHGRPSDFRRDVTAEPEIVSDVDEKEGHEKADFRPQPPDRTDRPGAAATVDRELKDEDFSRLDKAVMGYSSRPPSEEKGISADDERGMMHETGPKTELPAAGPDEPPKEDIPLTAPDRAGIDFAGGARDTEPSTPEAETWGPQHLEPDYDKPAESIWETEPETASTPEGPDRLPAWSEDDSGESDAPESGEESKIDQPEAETETSTHRDRSQDTSGGPSGDLQQTSDDEALSENVSKADSEPTRWGRHKQKKLNR